MKVMKLLCHSVAVCLLLAVASQAQFGPTRVLQSATLSGFANGPVSPNGVTIVGQNIGLFTLTWIKTGTVSACGIEVDSFNGTTWSSGGLIGAQVCTSSGGLSSFTLPSSSYQAVRLDISTTMVGGGNVVFVLSGEENTFLPVQVPAGYGATLVNRNGTAISQTQLVNAHWEIGNCTLGTNCAVTFGTAYTSNADYNCTATDVTTADAVKDAHTSASIVTLTGNSTDVIDYACFGF